MNDHGPATIGRHARALRILTCLQSGPMFNAKKLARQLRVSRRTIHRDLNLIREAGINVRYDGRDAAYRLAPLAHHLTPPTLSPDELMALVLAAHLSLVQKLPELADLVSHAVSKLLCSCSNELRLEASRLLNACILRLPPENHCSPLWLTLQAVLQAIRRQQQLRCLVADEERREFVQTLLAPYRLAVTTNQWVLVGRSSLHRCTRAFDVAAIQQIEPTEEGFQVPAGFHGRD